MVKFTYIPYTEISGLDGTARIKKILGFVEKENILIIDGRLKSTDEALLIRECMNMTDIEKFKGIEFGVLHSKKPEKLFEKIKHSISERLTGYSKGLTIVGPASVINELKQDFNTIELDMVR